MTLMKGIDILFNHLSYLRWKYLFDFSPRDAVRAIKKRLQQNVGKNYTVVMYTLTVSCDI